MTKFGIYITLAGAVITVMINVIFIPAYSYMASAWAHVASYGVMIGLSFVFARKHFRINYNMKELVPYFILAIGIVILSRILNYKNLAIELTINSFFIIIFILFAQHKDNLITIFLNKGSK
jgi:O-antigen/teichoic acid export membrane protein